MTNSNMESNEVIDRLASDMNEEFNRSGIVLERRPKPRPSGIFSTILKRWCEYRVKYTSAVRAFKQKD